MAELNLVIPIEEPQPHDLTNAEVELRIKFASEYFMDEDYYLAAIRCGYVGDAAGDMARRFRGDPYVQRLISAGARSAPGKFGDKEFEDFHKNNAFNMLCLAARDRGTDSNNASRVAAIKAIVSILGMDKPQQIETTVTVKEKPKFDFSGYTKSEIEICRQFAELQKSKEAKLVESE
ncbi:MAG: hypothetical protein OEY89_12545 [Gammaproteobacteria bacterium]|nr:hypothetical protein [Gammaproteobacteria bacterium]